MSLFKRQRDARQVHRVQFDPEPTMLEQMERAKAQLEARGITHVYDRDDGDRPHDPAKAEAPHEKPGDYRLNFPAVD